nr:transposase [Providencia rettgeri]
MPKAADTLGITDQLLYNWKAKFDAEQSGSSINSDERAELLRLRKKNKELRMEKEILKKASTFLLKKIKKLFKTMKQLFSQFPVLKLCKLMKSKWGNVREYKINRVNGILDSNPKRIIKCLSVMNSLTNYSRISTLPNIY